MLFCTNSSFIWKTTYTVFFQFGSVFLFHCSYFIGNILYSGLNSKASLSDWLCSLCKKLSKSKICSHCHQNIFVINLRWVINIFNNRVSMLTFVSLWWLLLLTLHSTQYFNECHTMFLNFCLLLKASSAKEDFLYYKVSLLKVYQGISPW